jgi:hypothetical protein
MEAMKAGGPAGSGYEERICEIRSRVQALGRELAATRLEVQVERGLMTPTRTSHTVRLFNGASAISVVLSREEFLDEFGLFDRAAVPRLRTAIQELTIR